jgi:hypothetical protein
LLPRPQALVTDFAAPRLHELSPAGLAKLVYGLAMMGTEDPGFYAAAADRWGDRLGGGKEGCLAWQWPAAADSRRQGTPPQQGTTMACGKLVSLPHPCPCPTPAPCGRVLEVVKDMAPHDVTRVMWALGEVRRRTGPLGLLLGRLA